MDTDQLAQRLRDAAASLTPIPPATDEIELTVEQDTTCRRPSSRASTWAPRRLAKLGLTSRANQRQMASANRCTAGSTASWSGTWGAASDR